jgi:hypothetical protein
MYELHSEKIDTPAGEYVVQFIADEYADQPENYGFSMLKIGDRRCMDVSVGDDIPAGLEGVLRARDMWDWEHRSGAAIVRWLTLMGKKGVTLVTDDYRPDTPTSDRFDRIAGVAWVDDDFTEPEKATSVCLEAWRAWAEGDVFGYVVTAPDGSDVGSCWGYYGFDRERDYVMSEARAAIAYDVSERQKKANLAGAGIVGLI